MSSEGVVVGEEKVLYIDLVLSSISDVAEWQSLANRDGLMTNNFWSSPMLCIRKINMGGGIL